MSDHSKCNHHHSQGHHHHHSHSHDFQGLSRSFLIGGIVNLIFVIFELVFGILTGSVSLIADAIHNFSDVVSLFLSWIGFKLNQSKPTLQLTYGLKKMSLMITFINAATLVLSLAYILYEAYQRFLNPQPVSENTIILIAGLGIAVNFLSALLFRHHQHDVNVKGAYLHLMMDGLISLGVVVAGLGIKYTGWIILDPLMACLIVLLIAKGTFSLLRESFILLIGGVPENLNLTDIQNEILSHKNIHSLHNLHVWSISSSEVALTAHIKLTNPEPGPDQILPILTQSLRQKFKIKHITLQIESGDHSDLRCS